MSISVIGVSFWITTSYLVVVKQLKAKRQKNLYNLLLEPEGNIWRVHNLITGLEAAFETHASIATRGLLLSYTIHSISGPLIKTGGFRRDIQRRYADMELLIREFNENAVDGDPLITSLLL